jgi:lipoprotein-anchoring transpeptidase ErfK/SrfK
MNNRSGSPTGKPQPNGQNQAQARGGSGKKSKRKVVLPVLLMTAGCAVLLFAAWSAVTSPVLASIINSSSSSDIQQTQRQSFAQVYIPKPTYTPQAVAMEAVSIPPTATLAPLVVPQDNNVAVVAPQENIPAADSSIVPDAPTLAPVDVVPQATAEVSGVAIAQIVVDTPTSEYVAPTAAPDAPPVVSNGNGGERWIDVDLTQQRLYAYEGDSVVASFLVSTGTWQTPTVTGKFKIWIKIPSQDMTGPGYYLPDVPYVMYFYKDYGLHGTYWHNNFGTPMSHGCVNLRTPDAEWLYSFASVGTVVNVHY